MSIVSKLFEIWAVSKTVSTTTPVFMRLLTGMAAIAVCAVVAAIIIALLIVGGFCLAYTEMIADGMDHQIAGLIIGSLLISLLGFLMLRARNYCYELRLTSKKIVTFQPMIGRGLSRTI